MSLGRLILNEKRAAAEQGRRAGEEDDVIPLHGLDSTCSVNPHRRFRLAGLDGSYSGSARSCPRGHRLSHAALAEADLDVMLIPHLDQFNVGSMGEVMMRGNGG